MTIIRADATQLAQVRQLWQRSRFLYHTLGAEDLALLLEKQIALLADERGQAWGFVCVQEEARAATLPADAPNRVYLRALALVRGRTPSVYVAELIEATIAYLHPSGQGHLLIAYADADWLRPPLYQAGFRLAEEVQFFELTRLPRWQPSTDSPMSALQFRPAQVADLSILAEMDAITFPALWHFDATALQEMLLTSRLQIGTVDREIVGYSALTTSEKIAHLARLAVSPNFQGHGLGKQLLTEALLYAQAHGIDTVVLNTQVHNRTAQHLYRAFGFRPTGRVTPVLTKRVPNIAVPLGPATE